MDRPGRRTGQWARRSSYYIDQAEAKGRQEMSAYFEAIPGVKAAREEFERLKAAREEGQELITFVDG